MNINYCYLMFDDAGTLLYVGITSQIEKRMRHHAKHQPWIWQVASVVFDPVGDRQLASDVETNYIKVLNPMWNIRKGLHQPDLCADLWHCPFDLRLLKLDRRFHASSRLGFLFGGKKDIKTLHPEVEDRMKARVTQARDRRSKYEDRTGLNPYVGIDPTPIQELNWPVVPEL